MIFNPQSLSINNGSFVLSKSIHAVSHPCLNKDIFKEFWSNFSFGYSSLDITVSDSEKYIFSVGDTPVLPLDGYDYSINIDTRGICISAKNEKTLIQGFVTLLDHFKAIDIGDEAAASAECCQIKDRACVQTRMVHYCIFPETELWELQRFIRFCEALKFTHLVLEFWGMLKYDCLKELSWSHGFTKDQIRPLIKEANDLGLEIIPMFNHWGHASAGRVMHGKHVVLDQNPSLQTYFSEDGWCWDIKKPKVRELLRKIRSELVELCGEGSYFHIGCDEAYNFELTTENMDYICGFINEINSEMTKENRRIIAWGDMFLYRHKSYNPNNVYTCNAPSPEAEQYMLSKLDKNIIIADWQYDAKQYPVETSSVFKNAGFDCIICPWDRDFSKLDACIETAKNTPLMGVMHTTWHTLSAGMRYVVLAAVRCFEDDSPLNKTNAITYSAALLRKVMPSGGDYLRSGWSKYQLGYKW